ncbi:MAG: HEAT repeat domain-containing protein [Balneolaceae bacterium]
MLRLFLFKCLLLVLFTAEIAVAQNTDYEQFRKMDVQFSHMDAEIRVGDLGSIEGEVDYDVRFLIGDIDSLMFDAVQMQVDDVIVNERTMDFEVSGDQLIIFLDDPFAAGDSAEISIVYKANPQFGLHRNYNNTIFTSLLPLSTKHWLPIIDHPRVSFSTDIMFIYSSSDQVVANGNRSENEVISIDEQSTRFVSRYALPATSLFFAVGDFEEQSRTINDNEIFLYQESAISDLQVGDEIFSMADSTLRELEELTGVDYPHRDLHVVVLNDVMWETRKAGSGVILVDSNENLSEQIQFGIMNQWAGVLLRDEQWNEPDAIQILNGYFAYELGLNLPGGSTWPQTDGGSFYDEFRFENVDSWNYYLQNNSALNDVIEFSIESLFDSDKKVYDWKGFSEFLYEETGQPFTERPQFEKPEVEQIEEYGYSVEMNWDDQENTVRILFEAVNGSIDELVTVKVEEITFDGVNNHELTFTGARDEVELSVSAGIENIVLTIEERDDVILSESKPFMFWIYQLQNADEPEQRIKAAEALSEVTDNPDLQLAMRDALNGETNGDVYASILYTLADLTKGASGTDQLFLERANERQDEPVQKAAAYSLSYFDGNSQAISRLRSLITNTESDEVRSQSVKSLAEITDADAFENIVEALITQEPTLTSVPLMLELLAEKGKEEISVQFSETFVSSEFPISIRYQVLEFMLEFDGDSDSWEQRLNTLLDDPDPRIRYKALDALEVLDESAREAVIERLRYEEFDDRVKGRIEN